jgi:hypothetical protein
MTDHVEAVARALSDADAKHDEAEDPNRYWETLTVSSKDEYRRHAIAAIAAYTKVCAGEAAAWVIPGADNCRDNGFLDAMAWQEGEFTKPLFEAPQPAPAVPAAAWFIDHTGCEHLSRNVSDIERHAATGPYQVHYLYETITEIEL